MNKPKRKNTPAINPLKQKIQLGVLGGLVLIALVIGGTQLQQSKASQTHPKNSAQASPSKPVPKNNPSSELATADAKALSPNTGPLIDLPVTWPMTLRRNPFVWSKLNVPADKVTLAAPDYKAINAQALTQLKLQGVMLDQNPRVLMNGVLLQLGSEVMGYEIKQIEKRAVIVTRQGVEVRISL